MTKEQAQKGAVRAGYLLFATCAVLIGLAIFKAYEPATWGWAVLGGGMFFGILLVAMPRAAASLITGLLRLLPSIKFPGHGGGAAILLALAFVACTPEQTAARKVRKACRLNPDLCRVDTVVVSDTIRIESSRLDTLVGLTRGDTVVIRQDRLEVRYFYNAVTDTLWLSGYYDSVEVIREVRVPVQKVEGDFSKDVGVFGWVLILLTFLVCLGIIKWIFSK